MSEMDKCREEFEKQRYWIGLFREAVDFDEELGRYFLNGKRKLYAFHLDSFNEKWEVWQKAWRQKQDIVDELQNNILFLQGWKKIAKSNGVDKRKYLEEVKLLQKRMDETMQAIDWHIEDCEMTLWMNKDDDYTNGFKAAMILVKTYLKEKEVK